MKELSAKSLLVKAKNPESWFGVEYTLNLYRGCTHGCIYCDSRSECYRIDNFEEITAKINGPELLRRELAVKRSKAVLGTGAMSDPYIPAERGLRLTRRVLEVIDEAAFPVHIITKSDLVLRDADVLKRIAGRSLASVGMTVTTCDDGLASWIEPYAPSPSRRLAALKKLSDEGVYTGVLLMPVLPFILDEPEQVLEVVRQAHRHGARYVLPWFGVTLRDRQRDYFYRRLDERMPGMRERYERSFGSRYFCSLQSAKRLSGMVEELCGELGMACRMSDIILKAPQKREAEPEQLELF